MSRSTSWSLRFACADFCASLVAVGWLIDHLFLLVELVDADFGMVGSVISMISSQAIESWHFHSEGRRRAVCHLSPSQRSVAGCLVVELTIAESLMAVRFDGIT